MLSRKTKAGLGLREWQSWDQWALGQLVRVDPSEKVTPQQKSEWKKRVSLTHIEELGKNILGGKAQVLQRAYIWMSVLHSEIKEAGVVGDDPAIGERPEPEAFQYFCTM